MDTLEYFLDDFKHIFGTFYILIFSYVVHIQSNPNWRSSENQLNTNRIGGPPELEVRQIKYDLGTEILTTPLVTLIKKCFVAKLETKNQNIFETETKSKTKNTTTENKLNLDK